ncbi:hypothetical protein BN2537_15685 [Streptomyces venezuelae]|nr:hypothetical protein BN2537_15685 [Streptomyces venezuelae]
MAFRSAGAAATGPLMIAAQPRQGPAAPSSVASAVVSHP